MYRWHRDFERKSLENENYFVEADKPGWSARLVTTLTWTKVSDLPSSLVVVVNQVMVLI